jgi:protein-disulfide isomerase
MRIEPPRPLLTPSLEPEDHILGPENAVLELVAYGDYQCPHCHAAHQSTKKIQEQFRGQLRFAWRHFPLSKIHPNARNAAITAEFAGDKFWLMHDLLFSDINKLSRPELLEYARQLSLDTAELTRAFDDNRYGERIRRDIASGLRSGVNTTPTFYINGRRHNGGFDQDALATAMSEHGAAPL